MTIKNTKAKNRLAKMKNPKRMSTLATQILTAGVFVMFGLGMVAVLKGFNVG